MMDVIDIKDYKETSKCLYKLKGKYAIFSGYFSQGFLYDKQGGDIKVVVDEWPGNLVSKLFQKYDLEEGYVFIIGEFIMRTYHRRSIGKIKKVELLDGESNLLDTICVGKTEIPKKMNGIDNYII